MFKGVRGRKKVGHRCTNTSIITHFVYSMYNSKIINTKIKAVIFSALKQWSNNKERVNASPGQWSLFPFTVQWTNLFTHSELSVRPYAKLRSLDHETTSHIQTAYLFILRLTFFPLSLFCKLPWNAISLQVSDTISITEYIML